MEKLTLFFNKIKELTFWQRLFAWSKIKASSYDAFEEYRNLEKTVSSQKTSIDELRNDLTKINTRNESLAEKNQELEKQIIKKESQTEIQTNKINELNETISELNTRISKFESTQEERAAEYEKKIAQLNQVKENLEKERTRLSDERVKEKEEHFENMKRQWSEHETSVEQTIKMICQNNLINYVDKVPFRGTPDNTIEIADEYIIFDAKSPSNDDLTSFPRYIKAQTDNVKKYVKQDRVKKDIFLVIPTNTIDYISQVIYNMGDYNVYVITKDSLEPIILSLKKIEDYEFAEQLSPEDRDNICRIIGRFAHTTKRKIQIDQFFASQFIELLVKCKNDLPDELLQQVVEFEKAEKLNPPTEKRAKQILTKELEEKNASINTEAGIRQIKIPQSFDDVKKLD